MLPEMDSYLNDINFSASAASKMEAKVLLEKEEIIKKYIRNHPKCSDLLKNILAEGQITVEFCDQSEIVTLENWSPLSRKIRLSNLIQDPFPLLESFILKLCNANIHKVEGFLSDLNQFSTLQDFLFLYPSADDFADNQAKDGLLIRNLTTEIYKTGMDHYRWPVSRTGVVRKELNNDEYLSSLKSTHEFIEGLTQYESLKKRYFEINLNMIEANKKRIENKILQNNKILAVYAGILVEMKKTIQTNREILGIKKGEVVYTESERMLQEYETKVKDFELELKNLKQEIINLDEKEKEYKQALDVLKIKSIKATPNKVHLNAKIELMTRIKNWIHNFNSIEAEVNGQQRARLNEIFITTQNLCLELEKLDAITVENDLKGFEEEINILIEAVKFRTQNSLKNRFLTWLGVGKKVKPIIIEKPILQKTIIMRKNNFNN